MNSFNLLFKLNNKLFFLGLIIADLAGVELGRKISQEKSLQDQCTSINSALSHLRTMFKNLKGTNVNKTPGRDGHLHGLITQFLIKSDAICNYT